MEVWIGSMLEQCGDHRRVSISRGDLDRAVHVSELSTDVYFRLEKQFQKIVVAVECQHMDQACTGVAKQALLFLEPIVDGSKRFESCCITKEPVDNGFLSRSLRFRVFGVVQNIG